MSDEYFLLVCDDVPHDVVLTDPGDRVTDVVQVVRRLTGLSLWRGKVLATRVPAVILAGVPQEDAAAAVSALRDVGARAEAREQPEPDLLKHWARPGQAADGPETAQGERKAPSQRRNRR